MRRRLRRTRGLVPQAARGLRTVAAWLIRHPTPWIVLLVVGAAGWALGAYARRADAFAIAHVIVDPSSPLEPPSTLLGRNLWTLDLRALAAQLQAQAPALRQVRVVRELPNRVRIEAIPRQAAAQIALRQSASRRWHVLAADGFLLPEAHAKPLPDLVELAGIERDGQPLRAGKLNEQPRLQAALRVLAQLERAPALGGRRLAVLDLSEPERLRFVLDEGLEIRCGSEAQLAAHLERLAAALKAMRGQPLAIRYIDVRFEEPVIGPAT